MHQVRWASIAAPASNGFDSPYERAVPGMNRSPTAPPNAEAQETLGGNFQAGLDAL